MNTNKEMNIAQLIIHTYLEYKQTGNVNNNNFKHLSGQVERFIINRYIQKGIYDKGDVLNDCLMQIHMLIINRSDILESCSSDNQENQKRVQSYFNKIVVGIFQKSDKDFLKDEASALIAAVKETLNSLLEEKVIFNIENKSLYQKNAGINNIEKFDGYDAVIPYTHLRHAFNTNNRKAPIDRIKLKEFIKNIFTELENYCFSFSDILRIVSQNTDLTISSYIEIYDSDDENNYSKYAVENLPSAEPDQMVLSENSDLSDVLLDRFIQLYDDYDEQLTLAAILFLRIKAEMSFVEIAGLLKEAFGKDIKKSTVELKLKSTIKQLNIAEIIRIDDPSLGEIISGFVSRLAEKYSIEKYLGD